MLHWEAGTNSALDGRNIKQGRDIGYVNMLRKYAGNGHEEISYDMTFAFVFKAFYPESEFHESK